MAVFINPSVIAPANPNSNHGILFGPAAKRLIIGAQTALRADGLIVDDFAGQIDQAFYNILSVLLASQMEPLDLVRLSVQVMPPGSLETVCRVRDARLGRLRCAFNYSVVYGLADPRFLVQIDGEAIREG